MLRMAQVNNIKDLYENEDLSLREISRKTGHSFKTVQKYAYQLNWSEDNLPETEPTSYPVLGDFIPVIDEWLEADRKIPRKQRHTVWRIFCRLRDEQHFTGGGADKNLDTYRDLKGDIDVFRRTEGKGAMYLSSDRICYRYSAST